MILVTSPDNLIFYRLKVNDLGKGGEWYVSMDVKGGFQSLHLHRFCWSQGFPLKWKGIDINGQDLKAELVVTKELSNLKLTIYQSKMNFDN